MNLLLDAEPGELLRLAALTYFQRMRMEWIEEMLDVYGFINREHICRKFEISVPQASTDLTTFQRLFPDRITYNKSAKQYERP